MGAGQHKLYKSELRKLDVHCSKLLHQFVEPTCGGTNATERFELWSKRCIFKYWTLVPYVAVLDDSRWLKRAFVWNAGDGRVGRSLDNLFAGGRTLGSRRLQPRTKPSGCGTVAQNFSCLAEISYMGMAVKTFWVVPR